jgi:hypothetical protein
MHLLDFEPDLVIVDGVIHRCLLECLSQVEESSFWLVVFQVNLRQVEEVFVVFLS